MFRSKIEHGFVLYYFVVKEGGRFVWEPQLEIHQTFKRLLYILVVIGSNIPPIGRINLNF